MHGRENHFAAMPNGKLAQNLHGVLLRRRLAVRRKRTRRSAPQVFFGIDPAKLFALVPGIDAARPPFQVVEGGAAPTADRLLVLLAGARTACILTVPRLVLACRRAGVGKEGWRFQQGVRHWLRSLHRSTPIARSRTAPPARCGRGAMWPIAGPTAVSPAGYAVRPVANPALRSRPSPGETPPMRIDPVASGGDGADELLFGDQRGAIIQVGESGDRTHI